jgi:hypothetical protein
MRKDPTAYSAAEGDLHDCSVRALAIAAGIPYEEAHRLFKEAGRADNKPTPTAVTRALFKRLGFTKHTTFLGYGARYNRRRDTWTPIANYPTLARFIKAHPRGRFTVHRTGHAFALINGVVHDWPSERFTRAFPATGSRSRVVGAWEVTR